VKRKTTPISVLLLVLVPTSLLAKSKARLYDLKSGEVFVAEFTGKWWGNGHGKITSPSAARDSQASTRLVPVAQGDGAQSSVRQG